MKKIISLLTCILLFTACDKLEKNGDLDGMWQLYAFKKADGTLLNTKAEQLYLSFQGDLMTLQKTSVCMFIGNFEQTSTTLSLFNIRQTTDNAELVTKEELERFYLSSTAPLFTVETLSKDKMILKTTDGLFYFRKY